MIRNHSSSMLRVLRRLAEEPLDRAYEDVGGFIVASPDTPGHSTFIGGFQGCRDVFWLETDEPEIVAALSTAIALNCTRADYLAQPVRQTRTYDPSLLSIVPNRFSATQGEIELVYDGERLEQYGDRIVLTASGWAGYPAAFWHVAAERLVRKRATDADQVGARVAASGGSMQ